VEPTPWTEAAPPAPAAAAAPPPAAPPAVPPLPGRRRAPARTAWLLRVTTTLLALDAVAQPLLIGRYLDGDYDAIGLHSGNAILLVLLTTAAGVAGLLYLVRGGSPGPFAALVLLWFLVGFQMGVGYSRNLTIHIPLGVAIVASTVALAAWSWTGRVFRRPR
jgi:hypothetical protein